MATIQFEVYWSAIDRCTFQLDEGLSLNDVMQRIIADIGIDEQNDAGNEIEYTLYRKVTGGYEPISLRGRTLQQAQIGPDEQLYLSDRKHPWFKSAETAPLGRRPRPERRVDEPGRGVTERSLACRLQIVDGYLVDVPRGGLILSRDFLFKKLPRNVIIIERLKSFFEDDTRLNRVSRKEHCEIFFEYNQWRLCAFEPTYIHGRIRLNKEIVIIEASTRMSLGHEGWPIEIQIYLPDR